MAQTRKIRIKDVAQKAGVSMGTVDRVIHNRGEVAGKTKEKVLKILHEMHYEPDILARILVSKKIWRFAIFIPGTFHHVSFWEKPLNGMLKALSEIQHFGVELERYLFDVFDVRTFEEQAAKILSSAPDGIVLAPFFSKHAVRFIKKCNDLHIPVVIINSSVPVAYPLSFIGQDSQQSGRVAAQMLEFGLSQGGVLGIVSIAKDLDEQVHIALREKGFRNYFAQQGHSEYKVIDSLHIADTDTVKVECYIRRYIQQHEKLAALFVTNSNVHKVVSALIGIDQNPIRLAGYDLTDENCTNLEKGYIDFLIGQKPEEQGYLGVMTLYNSLLLRRNVSSKQYLPIDIITKENLKYYRN